MMQAATADTKSAAARATARPEVPQAALQAPPVAGLGNQALLRLRRKCDCGDDPDCDCDSSGEKKHHKSGGLHRKADGTGALPAAGGSGCAMCGSPPALAIGAIDDPLEHDADQAAERVLRMADPGAVADGSGASTLRRQCSGGGETCQEEPEEKLRRKAAGAAGPGEAPPVVHEVLRSSGRPLDRATRAFFEPRFGRDFGGVRIHTDAQAAASAKAVGALAYTVGSRIVLGAGQEWHTASGRRLLAHELGHVVQHQGGGAPMGLHRLDGGTPQGVEESGPAADQKKCVRDLGGCPGGDRSGPGPSCDEIAAYNRECRARTGYSGPDVVADCPSGFVPDCKPPQDQPPEQKPPEEKPPEQKPPEQKPAPPPPPACTTPFAKAGTFPEIITLVRAAEAKLDAAGITSAKDQIHALRGIYYGTTWSLDYAGSATEKGEGSETRNEGFQRFTRPSESPDKTVPTDVRSILNCGLFDALKASQDVGSPVKVDFGHIVIALDARYDPDRAKDVEYPYGITSVAMGGTGTELVTWLGDLGGGAAKVALARAAVPTSSSSLAFDPSAPSDYGGSINLEGDIAGAVIATSSPTAITAPDIPAGKKLSDALTDYLTPPAATTGAPPSAWKTRAHTFLAMYGGAFDASGKLTNGATLIGSMAPKIQTFACNYLGSRVKDKRVTFTVAKQAANHVIPASQEVAEAFVNALAASALTGDKIEAKVFPAAKAAVSGACGTQINAGGLLQFSPF